MTRLNAAEERNAGIDLFRGLLILAVIWGHFSELTQRDSFMTWMGAGVRMPVFIGLTGYLFNLDRARAMPLALLLRKYFHRLILPWLVASLVYLTVTTQVGYLTTVSLLFQPPYHLWFVPILMTFIILAALSRNPPATMVALAVPASIAAMYVFGVGHKNYHFVPWMPDRRFFIYPIYFFYGLWVARREPDVGRQRLAMVIAPLGFLWWCALYERDDILPEVAASLLTSLSLIYLLPRLFALPIKSKIVQGIGCDSLFYYLWHPMAFGLLASIGASGATMVILSMLTLIAAHKLASRHAGAARLLGIQARRQPRPAMQIPAVAQEQAL